MIIQKEWKRMKHTVIWITVFLFLVGIALTTAMAEDTFDFTVPESVLIGMPFDVTVSLPKEEGSVTFEIDHYWVGDGRPADSEWPKVTIFNDNVYDFAIQAAGDYYLKAIWQRDGQSSVSKTKKIRFEAGAAVKKPTLSVFDSSGNETTQFHIGDKIVLRGSAGSADQLILGIASNTGNGYTYSTSDFPTVTPDQNGNWSYTYTDTAKVKFPVFFVSGYTVDGRYVGRTDEKYVHIYDPAHEPPAPEAKVESFEDYSSFTDVVISVSNPDPETYNALYFDILDETGASIYHNGYTIDEEGDEISYQFQYQGTYTFLITCYREDDESDEYAFSKPCSVQVEITGGKPAPVNGKQTIPLIFPETWTAMTDMPVSYTPTVPNQVLFYSVTRQTSNYSAPAFSGNASGGDFTIPGYALTPGDYVLWAHAEADTYEATTKEFYFTVVDNPESIEGPTLVSVSDPAYPQTNLTCVLDKVWEKVHLNLKDKNGYSATSCTAENSSKITFMLYTPGEYELQASGFENGLWSEPKVIGTVTVQEIPTVDKLTVLSPESVRLGEAFQILAFFPDKQGPYSLIIQNTDSGNIIYERRSYLYGQPYLFFDFQDHTLLGKQADTENYVLKLTWNETETLEKPILITGEQPELCTLNTPPFSVEVGNPISLSGTVGSAKRMGIQCNIDNRALGNLSYSYSADPADGNWTCNIPTFASGKYDLSIRGYSEDGLCTGYLHANVYVTDQNSLPAPETELMQGESGKVLSYSMTAPGYEDEESIWNIRITNEKGEVLFDFSSWNDNGLYAEDRWLGQYGTYTLTACYSIDGKISFPTAKTIALKETLPFCSWNGRDQAVYYLDADSDFETLEYDALQQDSFVTQYWLNNHDTYRDRLDGDPVFSYEVEGQAVFEFTPWPESDQPAINVHLKKMPETPETDIIHLSCEWGDLAWSQDYTVTFLQTPENGLPTGIDLSFDEPLTFVAGTEWNPDNMISFKNGWQNEDDDFWNVDLTILRNNYEQDWDYVRWDAETRTPFYTINDIGQYNGLVVLTSGKLVWKHPVEIIVTDENGSYLPSSLPIQIRQSSYNYYISELDQTIDEKGRFSRDDHIAQFSIDYESYLELQESMGGEPEWSMEIVSGNLDLGLDDAGLFCNLCMNTKPEAEDTTVILLSCSWGDLSFEKEITVHAMNLPGDLPEGIELSFGDVLVQNITQPIPTVREYTSFIDNWQIEGEPLRHGYQFYTEYDNTSAGITFNNPGVYDAYVELNYANIVCCKSYTVVITDKDGAMPKDGYRPEWTKVLLLPAGLTEIQESAFEGISAERVVIPDGCKKICANAFGNCRNLREITIPASVTEIDEHAFDGCVGVLCVTDSDEIRELCPSLGLIPVLD